MKRKLISIVLLVLIATLVLSVSPAGAEVRRLGLISAKVEGNGGGTIFSFNVWGDFDKFTGWVRFQGSVYDLRCNLNSRNSKVLICRTYNAPNMADQTVQVVVNGFSFDTYVKHFNNYCRHVYDWPWDGESPEWVDYGRYCTDYKPQVGNEEWFTIPYWGTWKYVFLGEGAFCGPDGSWNDFGVGWYYPFCNGGL